MAPQGANQALLSPAELAYLHASLAHQPPLRPDLRAATQFRPVVAESTVLPTANGSARVCFSDSTEALVGVKAEVERSAPRIEPSTSSAELVPGDSGGGGSSNLTGEQGQAWLTVSLDIPGSRDDDPLPVFLSSLLKESLVASPELRQRLRLNARWHWRLYVDILLLSPPLSYPLPLLSLTTHLALLDTRLPRRTSEVEDDPLFDDDWDAAVPLYSAEEEDESGSEKPPMTLLVMTVGENLIFDPSKEELAVADSVVAVSLGLSPTPPVAESEGAAKTDVDTQAGASVRVITARMIDPPSRLTPLGIPQAANTTQATQGGTGSVDVQGPQGVHRDYLVEEEERGAVWNPPRGGIKTGLLRKVLEICCKKGGVGEEVLAGLAKAGT